MILFKRRDTRLWVLALGGFAALMPMSFALGTPDYWPAVQLPLGVIAFAAVAAVILRWRHNLPPDLDLEWVEPEEAARLLAAPPPVDATMLLIAFERDWPRRARLDVVVDGKRTGQLPPGTATLLPLGIGPRKIEVFLDRPRTAVSELVNALPGGFARYSVRNRGSRAIELEIRRVPGPHPPTLSPPMCLVQARPH